MVNKYEWSKTVDNSLYKYYIKTHNWLWKENFYSSTELVYMSIDFLPNTNLFLYDYQDKN